jgi:alpha-beta hydrolase superfamily lysophospholipase
VLDYILHEEAGVKGLILSAPPIDSSKAASPVLVATARAISGFWPTFSMKSPLNASQLSCDQAVVDNYLTDPLVFHTMSVRWGTEYLDTQSWVREHAAELDLPILLLHGDADEICLVDGSRWLFEQITHTDKTLKIYPGGFHESHNEPGHDLEIEDIVKWLDEHIVMVIE